MVIKGREGLGPWGGPGGPVKHARGVRAGHGSLVPCPFLSDTVSRSASWPP